MTAPDRLWIAFATDEERREDPKAMDLVFYDGHEDEEEDVLYIRKGAFPVEEIRDRIIAAEQNIAVLGTLNKPELNGALCCLDASLETYRRILSLLESDDE